MPTVKENKETTLEEIKESPLLNNEPETPIEPPDYSDDEQDYIKGLRTKLENARISRDQEHDEFDGMSYWTNYELNERFANTFIAPKKNKEDTNFQSGVIRQKILAIMAAVANLNLSGDISAFDPEGLQIQGLGDAMEDVILKTDDLDNDDEKKFLRQWELFKHGTVFVEEIWDERMEKDKDMKGKKFDGKITGYEWKVKLKKAFARPSRNVVPGINVYLGDITKYGNTTEQPYLFTVDVKPYEEAKLIFGGWDRWKNVPKKIKQFDSAGASRIFNLNWRLFETRENYVEIIRYQDKWNNEFAVLCNGILMTPVGLPLPWGYKEYNLVMQNLEPIHPKFAYGKGLVAKLRNKASLLDEFIKLGVLKSQRSFAPPMINLSGRILSSRVLMPGKFTHGIPKDSLVPVAKEFTEGVTQAEWNMINDLKTEINNETNPIYGLPPHGGRPTATEIIELQRQTKLVIGLSVFACSMLEWKLDWLRLQNLLVNWFNPEDQVVDEARKMLKDKYRITSVDKNIPGKGQGRHIIIPTKQIPSSRAIQQSEQALSKEQGKPVRLTFIDPEQVKSAKLTWQIVVRPKERKTSETEKLLFRAFMQDVIPLQPDMDYIREEFASIWAKNPSKLFAKPYQDPMAQGQEDQGGQPGQSSGNGSMSPRVNLPTPEKAFASQTQNTLAQGH